MACTWHMMQVPFSDKWSESAFDDDDVVEVLVFNFFKIASLERPVLTSPICSPNARSSCAHIKKGFRVSQMADR